MRENIIQYKYTAAYIAAIIIANIGFFGRVYICY